MPTSVSTGLLTASCPSVTAMSSATASYVSMAVQLRMHLSHLADPTLTSRRNTAVGKVSRSGGSPTAATMSLSTAVRAPRTGSLRRLGHSSLRLSEAEARRPLRPRCRLPRRLRFRLPRLLCRRLVEGATVLRVGPSVVARDGAVRPAVSLVALVVRRISGTLSVYSCRGKP